MKKKRIYALLLSLLLLVPDAFALGNVKKTSFDLKNESASLHLNGKNMQLSYQLNGSEQKYELLRMNGQKGSRVVKNNQKSAITLQFFSSKRSATLNGMDSFSLSVDKKGAVAEGTKQHLKVHYTIGAVELTVDDLPKAIPLAKYNERLKPAWSEKENKQFTNEYRLVTRASGESYFFRANDDTMGKVLIKKLHELLFVKAGYTPEDLLEDNTAVGHLIKSVNPKIELDMLFHLDGADLIATVPASSIQFTKDNDVVSFDFLPYFLSSSEEENGYMFIPDGVGALIRFNNQKTSISAFKEKVFGKDKLVRAHEYTPEGASINLPIFGIKTDKGAILAIIEEGAALATINAEVSGHSDEFNRVYPTFNLLDIERVMMGGNEKVTTPRWQQDNYQGDIRIRYKFLEGSDIGYVEMANAYREYLTAKGDLPSPKKRHENAPLLLEVVGAVRKSKFFLGIPYDSTISATKVTEAQEIYDKLKLSGIDNIHLIYNGLFANGVHHGPIDNAAFNPGIASAAQIQDFIARIEQNGDSIYPAVNLNKIYTRKGFSASRHAARGHDGVAAEVHFNLEDRYMTQPYQGSAYIGPRHLGEYSKKSLHALQKLGFHSVCIQDLGQEIIPSYKRKEHVSSIHAIPFVEQAFKNSPIKNIMLETPNSYALKYANFITSLSRKGSGYKLIDERIPFTQMVYDGCIPYASSSWNLNPDFDFHQHLLYALETKTAPRFTICAADPTVFQNTMQEFMAYFRTNADGLLPEIVSFYRQYNDFYQKVKDARIKKHIIHNESLREVHFENGVQLLLNYGNDEAKLDGQVLPALSYIIKEVK